MASEHEKAHAVSCSECMRTLRAVLPLRSRAGSDRKAPKSNNIVVLAGSLHAKGARHSPCAFCGLSHEGLLECPALHGPSPGTAKGQKHWTWQHWEKLAAEGKLPPATEAWAARA